MAEKTLIIEELEEFNKYTDFLDRLEEKDEINIILDSGGGRSSIADYLIGKLLWKNYRLYVYNASSAALVMLDALSKWAEEINIAEYAFIVAHIWRIEVKMWDGWKLLYWEDRYIQETAKYIKPYHFDFLNEEEQKRYLDGEDIYIQPRRLQEYYNNLKKDGNTKTK